MRGTFHIRAGTVIAWITAGAVAALILWISFYLIFQRPNRLQASRLTVHLEGLGGDRTGIRLAFLSDLHIRRPGKIFRRAAEETARFQPDLILWGGDFYAWLTHEPSLRTYLAGFHAPAGSYAVQGNWEYKLQKTGPRLRRMLDECGIDTGLDIDRVLEVGRMVEKICGKRLKSWTLETGRIPKKPIDLYYELNEKWGNKV